MYSRERKTPTWPLTDPSLPAYSQRDLTANPNSSAEEDICSDWILVPEFFYGMNENNMICFSEQQSACQLAWPGTSGKVVLDGFTMVVSIYLIYFSFAMTRLGISEGCTLAEWCFSKMLPSACRLAC